MLTVRVARTGNLQVLYRSRVIAVISVGGKVLFSDLGGVSRYSVEYAVADYLDYGKRLEWR